MPKYWMITNRNAEKKQLGRKRDKLRFYVSDAAKVEKLESWTEKKGSEFREMLIQEADAFPEVPEHLHEKQKHVSVFIHGYNNSWDDAAKRYKQITDDLYLGDSGLGINILFNWPSDGSKFGYYPDREDARETAPDLSHVLNELYEHALKMQRLAANGTRSCKAKVSVIAHSMGNFVLQNAMRYTWERQNKPLSMSLLNQCLMVGADVDNDLFGSGEAVGPGDGEGIANLCYRIVALYSGRDSVLGMSSGLKHFGKRRLGRSGLDLTVPAPDNVCDLDCSRLFPADENNVHSAYFWTPNIQAVMSDLLRGFDRKVVAEKHGL
ncbi:MAG: alpha/beta hydrolase [Verrucomicrobiales bacterium]|nr:alpha/beta hydrolase [Verrucomicrobiales bacterium]